MIFIGFRKSHPKYPEMVRFSRKKIARELFLRLSLVQDIWLFFRMTFSLITLCPDLQEPNMLQGDFFATRSRANPLYCPTAAYLDEVLSSGWIGRRRIVGWPVRCPDVTPLDYFSWTYLKCKIYLTKKFRRNLETASTSRIPKHYSRCHRQPSTQVHSSPGYLSDYVHSLNIYF